MLTGKGLLLLLNSFIFSLASVSIGFSWKYSKSKNTMSVASNIVLGTCFISGVL